MWARSRAFSVAFPLTPFGLKSTSKTCVSVPCVTVSSPPLINSSDRAWAFLITCLMYCLKSGRSASPNATALAAITCIKGPPWIPGKIAELNFFAKSASFVRIIPPLGPRSVLCVVVVATWQCGNGDGYSPAAINPAKCATSAKTYAPTLSAILRIFAKSIVLGIADPPAMINFGLCAFANSAIWS